MMNRFQSGMSSLTLLIVLIGSAFILLSVFKIGPLYLDNYFVKSSVEALQDEDVRKMSNRQIYNALSRYFTINGVRDISPKVAIIERSDTKTLVKIDYEKRVNFFGNLDVVVRFENHFDTSNY